MQKRKCERKEHPKSFRKGNCQTFLSLKKKIKRNLEKCITAISPQIQKTEN